MHEREMSKRIWRNQQKYDDGGYLFVEEYENNISYKKRMRER